MAEPIAVKGKEGAAFLHAKRIRKEKRRLRHHRQASKNEILSKHTLARIHLKQCGKLEDIVRESNGCSVSFRTSYQARERHDCRTH